MEAGRSAGTTTRPSGGAADTVCGGVVAMSISTRRQELIEHSVAPDLRSPSDGPDWPCWLKASALSALLRLYPSVTLNSRFNGPSVYAMALHGLDKLGRNVLSRLGSHDPTSLLGALLARARRHDLHLPVPAREHIPGRPALQPPSTATPSPSLWPSKRLPSRPRTELTRTEQGHALDSDAYTPGACPKSTHGVPNQRSYSRPAQVFAASLTASRTLSVSSVWYVPSGPSTDTQPRNRSRLSSMGAAITPP